MALKLRISLYVALGASGLTLLVGALNSITVAAMVYRTLVSLVLFAVLGYICGQFAERFFQEKVGEIEAKGKNLDIISSSEHGEELPDTNFEPLNPEDFENITLTQK